MCFINNYKAFWPFDCIDHFKQYYQANGCSRYILFVSMWNLHAGEVVKIMTEYEESEWFHIGRGAGQRYIFIISVQHAMWVELNWKGHQHQRIQGSRSVTDWHCNEGTRNILGSADVSLRTKMRSILNVIFLPVNYVEWRIVKGRVSMPLNLGVSENFYEVCGL